MNFLRNALRKIKELFHPLPSREVVRLNREVYRQLEQQYGAVGLGPNTTELQAGYQLGVQSILKALREGYVVS